MPKKLVRIGDLGQVITGKTPPTKNLEYYGGDTPFLTPSDDMGGKYVKKTSRALTSAGVAKAAKCLLPPGAICMSCIGSDLGKVVITRDQTVTNQQINSVIPDKDIVDPEYLYYSMLPLGRQLNGLSKTSTAIPIINKTTFSNCKIALVDMRTQHTIGHILATLDAKIEINNRINDHLAA